MLEDPIMLVHLKTNLMARLVKVVVDCNYVKNNIVAVK